MEFATATPQTEAPEFNPPSVPIFFEKNQPIGPASSLHRPEGRLSRFPSPPQVSPVYRSSFVEPRHQDCFFFLSSRVGIRTSTDYFPISDSVLGFYQDLEGQCTGFSTSKRYTFGFEIKQDGTWKGCLRVSVEKDPYCQDVRSSHPEGKTNKQTLLPGNRASSNHSLHQGLSSISSVFPCPFFVPISSCRPYHPPPEVGCSLLLASETP